MPLRRAIKRESHNDHVLFVEELRDRLGIGCKDRITPPAPDANKPLEVLLVGHDLQAEFKNLTKHDIDLGKYFNYTGCIDTRVMTEDTDPSLPGSLTSLVQEYNLAQCHWSRPKRKEAKWVFDGAHNAGNDAIATLKVAIAQALDLSIHSCGSRKDYRLEKNWICKRLHDMQPDLLLMAYDTENVENHKYKPHIVNRTGEHGFAWLRTIDIKAIAPGPNGVNWHPYIRARHWINEDFGSFENCAYLVGNRDGFWEGYGHSQYYDSGESPTPFHDLFAELAGDWQRQQGIMSQTDTGGVDDFSAFFSPLPRSLPNASDNVIESCATSNIADKAAPSFQIDKSGQTNPWFGRGGTGTRSNLALPSA